MELTVFVPGQIWLCAYPIKMGGMRFDARMTVLRLRSGELMLHSPCAINTELAKEISILGPVAHIVAPGNYHTKYIAAAQAAFPNAKTWICPGIERRRPDIPYDGILGDAAPADWALEIDQALVQGRIMSELVMLHRASRTLIVVDLIENFTDATPHVSVGLKIWFKYLLRMWDNPRPAPEYRAGWSDRQAAARSLGRILAWDFDRIIVSHGDLIENDAKAKARQAWQISMDKRALLEGSS